MTAVLSMMDWWSFFMHFASLSLLAIGGAISTAPDIHRFVVDEQHWLNDIQFTSSIALAQGAPGPNVLFIGLIGWNVGLNAGGGFASGWTGVALGLWGMLLAMTGMLLPSTTLAYFAARWGHHNRDLPAVRSFKAGMAPIVIALLFSTGWLLTGSHDNPAKDWPLWLLSAVTMLVVWKTKTHILVLLAMGALLGALGWV